MIPSADAARRATGNTGNRHVGFIIQVCLHHVAEIHSVKLVTGKDHHVLDPPLFQIAKIFANCVSRPLVPLLARVNGLLGRQ
jgi:hypothetical protein